MEVRNRQRARLYLKSEEALGLESLAIRLRPSAAVPAPAPQLRQPPAVPSKAAGSPPAALPARAQPALALPMARPQPPAKLFAGESADFTAPPLSRQQKIAALADLDKTQVSVCEKCELHTTRKHTVFGEGDPDARLMFIGEGPGENEDLTGRPFVGRAGQKLDDMIAAMGLKREQVYIANIVKCRPPGNRAPAPEEVERCTPYLLRQIEIIRPLVIVTLGLPATRFILQSNLSMGKMRGQWHTWRGIKVMPTFHPSYLLRVYTLETRKAVWSDLQKVMTELGLKSPRAAQSP